MEVFELVNAAPRPSSCVGRDARIEVVKEKDWQRCAVP
jgi:hypothetical protein